MKKLGTIGIKQGICLALLLEGILLAAVPAHTLAAEADDTEMIGAEQAAASDSDIAVQDEYTALLPSPLPSTVRELFDAEYYRLLYPDLSVLGDDPDALYQHYIQFGLKEGRKCSPYLDLARYIAENEDLQQAFGSNTDAYVAHYFAVGIKENRSSYDTEFDRYLQTVLKSAENPDRTLYGQALLDFNLSKTQTQAALTGVNESKDQSSSGNGIQVHENTIIIPWDYVENGYVTLDMIRAHCGENLILVQNKQGDVTFLAGDISSRSVADSASALEAVKSMFGVLKLDDEADLYLSLTSVTTDSEGNSIYEFKPQDQASGRYATTITDVELAATAQGYYQAVVRLKAGTDGTVIALTSTSEDSYTSYQIRNKDGKVIDSRTKAISTELSAAVKNKYEILGEYTRNYQDAAFYKGEFFVKDKTDGTIGILYYDYVDGENIFYKIDPKVYEASEGKDSYPLDYLLTQASYENMTLTDCYGNEVTVPVAHMTTAEGENVYYLASKEDNTLMFVHSGKENLNVATQYSEKDLVKLSMGQDGKLTPVNAALNMGDLVFMYSSILDARRYFQTVDPVKSDSEPYTINYYYEDKTENAMGGDDSGFMNMSYYNSYLLKTYDTAIHEATHSMTIGQYFSSYTNYNGAISEGCADIMGLTLQKKKYDELVKDYMSGHEEASLQDAQAYVGSHFADFSNTWYASYYKDENGSIKYLYDADDPCNKSGAYLSYATKVGDKKFGYFKYSGYETYDNYNCHANSSVLSHIAYEMYRNGIVENEEELARIWYDSMNYLTGESEFYDVRYYVEESMKEHGCSQEAIEKADELFEECNITLETRDQDLLATPDKKKAENNLSTETTGNAANSQQNKKTNEQAARVSDQTEETKLEETELEETELEETETEDIEIEDIKTEDIETESDSDVTADTSVSEEDSQEQAVAEEEQGSEEQGVEEVQSGSEEEQSSEEQGAGEDTQSLDEED